MLRFDHWIANECVHFSQIARKYSYELWLAYELFTLTNTNFSSVICNVAHSIWIVLLNMVGNLNDKVMEKCKHNDVQCLIRILLN